MIQRGKLHYASSLSATSIPLAPVCASDVRKKRLSGGNLISKPIMAIFTSPSWLSTNHADWFSEFPRVSLG